MARPPNRHLVLAMTSTALTVCTAVGARRDRHLRHRPGGRAAPGWTWGSTGGGTPKWTIAADAETASGRYVLKQSGKAPFPWCVKQDTAPADGIVEVKFKPLAGREDQAGGVVWRWKDGDDYYVARTNALENNVSRYYAKRGRRRTMKYVDAPVAPNAWHTLRGPASSRWRTRRRPALRARRRPTKPYCTAGAPGGGAERRHSPFIRPPTPTGETASAPSFLL